jgi:hypothetical protein
VNFSAEEVRGEIRSLTMRLRDRPLVHLSACASAPHVQITNINFRKQNGTQMAPNELPNQPELPHGIEMLPIGCVGLS